LTFSFFSPNTLKYKENRWSKPQLLTQPFKVGQIPENIDSIGYNAFMPFPWVSCLAAEITPGDLRTMLLSSLISDSLQAFKQQDKTGRVRAELNDLISPNYIRGEEIIGRLSAPPVTRRKL